MAELLRDFGELGSPCTKFCIGCNNLRNQPIDCKSGIIQYLESEAKQ